MATEITPPPPKKNPLKKAQENKSKNIVRTQNEIKDVKKYALVRKGVRQGWSVSPLLFNIYFIESAIKQYLKKKRKV